MLLGAGAAIGPIETLLAHGAHVTAFDLREPAVRAGRRRACWRWWRTVAF